MTRECSRLCPLQEILVKSLTSTWSVFLKFEDRSVRRTVPFKYRSFYERFYRSVRSVLQPFRSKFFENKRSWAERNGSERSMSGWNSIGTVKTAQIPFLAAHIPFLAVHISFLAVHISFKPFQDRSWQEFLGEFLSESFKFLSFEWEFWVN